MTDEIVKELITSLLTLNECFLVVGWLAMDLNELDLADTVTS